MNKHISFMRHMIERQFLFSVPFVFPFPLLVSQKAELFMNLLSTVIHLQPLLWSNLPLVLGIMIKKKELNREKDTTRLLEVTIS